VNFVISDLRRRPKFFDQVADCIWRAWWKDRGYAFDSIAERLRENLNDDSIPFALVAHQGPLFLGTASVIASDLEDFPDYSPWVAAVWVEPEQRNRKIGRELVAQAASDAFNLGFDRLYLCAQKPRRPFYIRQGWIPIREDIGNRRLTVFVKDAPLDIIASK
jgi:GNAT superfamily N-acetyltransferase